MISDILNLIEKYNKWGIKFIVKNDQLTIKTEKDTIPDWMLLEIKNNKEQIISFLKKKIRVLSFAQERLWFIDQYEHNASYNLPTAIRLFEGINIEVLEKTLVAIVSRHEILRTNFVTINNEPKQVIHEKPSCNLEIVNLSHLSKEAADKQLMDSINEASQKPFDLENDSLIRFILYTINEGESIFFMNLHHIISDGWSFSILINEIAQIYKAYSNNKPSPLQELPIQYADYAIWQRRFLEGEVLRKQIGYWKDKLEGVAILELPTDKARPKEQTFNGNRLPVHLNKDITDNLNQLSRENNVTLFMTLLSTFKLLLQKYTGQADICVGSPIANRTRSEIEGLIGFFVNTLALRSYVDTDLPFNEFLKTVKATMLEAYENQDIPFEKVVDIVKPERNLSYSPLFQVMMNLQNTPEGELKFSGIQNKPAGYEFVISKFDINLSLIETERCLYGSIEYNTDLFEIGTIERMANHFTILIEQVIENPAKKIRDIEMLTLEEKHQLLVEWNDTKVDYPIKKCIHQLFEEQAEKNPTNIAVVCGNNKLTYRELEQKTNQLARYITQNYGNNKIIAICLEPSLEMIIGLIGIIKTGASFLPIDPLLPEKRIHAILANSSCSLLINHNIHLSIPDIDLIDFNELNLYQLDNSSFTNKSCSDDLIYLIYTSGTTGLPKGVQITHKNLGNYLEWFKNKFSISKKDKTVLLTSFAFDLGYTSLFTALLNGCELHLLPKEKYISPSELITYLNENKITYIKLTPSLFSIIANYDDIYSKDLSCLKYILLGGEKIIVKDVKKILQIQPKIQIVNHYGPTEATIGCITYDINENNLASLNNHSIIGKPINNTQVYILDKNKQLLPSGIYGELIISGNGVGLGYLNNDSLTNDKFIPNPFMDNTVMYCTGDLARWLPDGNIEFLGRVDNQVKIRGHRIELREIENQLLTHEEIKEALVIVKSREENKYLVGYYVSKKKISTPELKSYLSQILPDYMIPSFFIHIETMPLTPNGKIDKKALPEPEIIVGNEYMPPSNKTEKKLVKMWSEILNIPEEKIGVTANFFDLGGHSLLSIMLLGRINKEFEVNIPLTDLFKHPRIKDLSDEIISAKRLTFVPIESQPYKEYYLLSSAQRRLYFLQRFSPESIAYNMPNIRVFQGEIEKEKTEQTFNRLIERHESFRTSIHMVDNEPMQKIHEKVNFSIEYYQADDKAELDKLIRDFIRPFSLDVPCFLRVGIIKTSHQEYILMWDMHHIISDAQSNSILLQDYMRLQRGEELEPLKLSYKDYAEWQQSSTVKESLEHQKKYWIEQFEGELPMMDLPFDYPRPALQSQEGVVIRFDLNKEAYISLKQLAKEENATLFMVMLTCFNILLSKLSRQSNIIIGTPIIGRSHPDLEKIVGMFVNTLALRNNPDDKKSFKEFLQEVRNNCISSFENQDYQFEDLVEELDVKRDTGRNPVFDVMFNYIKEPDTFNNLTGNDNDEATAIPKDYISEKTVAKFDLTFNCYDRDKSISCSIGYCTALFKEKTIRRFITYFETMLGRLMSNPDVLIKELSILPDIERKQLVEDFNNTKADYPKDKTIIDLFEKQVAKTPHNTALIFQENKLTYIEFSNKVNQTANYILTKGITRGDIVGLISDRSLEMMVGIYAILKAGAVYLPIDPNYPEHRIDFIIKNSQTKILLCQKKYKDTFNTSVEFLPIKDDEINTFSTEFKNTSSKPNDLMYIIYTSGSTGNPKGVMIEHHSLVNRINWMKKSFQISHNDVFMQKTTIVFDVSVWELFWWSIEGVPLFILNQQEEKQPKKIIKAIEENKVSILHFVPSMLHVFLEELNDDFEYLRIYTLKYVFSSGEALAKNDVSKFNKTISKKNYTKLINLYGPTEATIDVTCFDCSTQEEYELIPIGKPIDNITLHILDNNLNILPIGVPGELSISGVGLARGYINNEILTKEKFVPNPYCSGEKMYKTGDLARWLPDGNIEFLGRMDNQVKIRGYRIELAEIESVLMEINGIEKAVCIVHDKSKEDKRIVAFIVLSDNSMGKLKIKKILKSKLPDYMLPSIIVVVDELPLTLNGKIDKKTLGALLTSDIQEDNNYISPKTETEKQIATIWKDLLSVEKVSLNDTFFDLGGHSLLLLNNNAQIKKLYNVELPFIEYFNQTLEQISKSIDNKLEVGIRENVDMDMNV